MTLSLPVQLAVLRAIEDRLKVVNTSVKDAIRESMEPGAALPANLPDGTKLGRVSMAEGRVTTFVESEPEFVGWVRERYPSEVVESVRDSFRTKLLDEAKRTGALPPGIGVKVGNPVLRFNSAPGAGAAIAELWTELTHEVLQIEGAQ